MPQNLKKSPTCFDKTAVYSVTLKQVESWTLRLIDVVDKPGNLKTLIVNIMSKR